MNSLFAFDIPMIFSKEVLDKFISKDIKLQFYVSLNENFPTGRPNDKINSDKIFINDHIQTLKALNININVLINGFASNYFKYQGYFNWIDLIVKPDIVTISDKNLISYVQKRYNWNIEVSAIAGIENQNQFYNFLNGINIERIKGIVFHHNNTRKGFDNEFIDLLKKKDIIPRVLVTESCYHKCPFRQEHYNSFFNVNSNNNSKFINHFQLYCILKRLKNPESLIDLSGFLLPEQLKEYYRKTGIDHFKISGRSESENWIANTAKAYFSEKSPKNIFEIIVYTSPFLEEFGMKIQDLFYLNSEAYTELYYELIKQSSPKLRQSFLKKKAAELFLDGNLKINDPNSQYDVVKGSLKMITKGNYHLRLEKELNNYLESNQKIKLKKQFIKSYDKTF